MDESGHRRETSRSDSFLTPEGQQTWIPFMTSPFVDGGETSINGVREAKPAGELPWSDLLLEVAMTTAFASLTDGTPILRRTNVLSYLAFFALVWWTWASQVTYNVRFRQDDWIHRLFAFLQLLIFAGLAAFTNGFDITNGLRVDKDQIVTEQLLENTFRNKADLAASRFRNDLLPTLNARGISFVMGSGRLVLLAQYCLAIFHARKGPFRSLCVHVGTLVVSASSYFAAFIIIGSDPNKADNAFKLVLWYSPIFLEIISHFWANNNRMSGRVRYSFETIVARASSSFVIILGGGLDKITNTFQYIVGNVSINGRGAGFILSAITIFTAQFMLYFGMIRRLQSNGQKLEPGDSRSLIWFFSHYFFLGSLIVTLQAVAALLVFGNITLALDLPVSKMVSTIGDQLLTGPYVILDNSNFTALNVPLSEIGMALETIVNNTNDITEYSMQENITSGAFNNLLQWSVGVSYVALRNLDATPELNSLLDTKIDLFLADDPTDTQFVNTTSYKDLVEELIYERGKPALWFFPAAGLTLLTLASLSFIVHWPRDAYEWGVVSTRIVFGILVTSMSILSFGAGRVALTGDWEFDGTKIWNLALTFWVLPMFAMTLVVEQLIEVGLIIFKGRRFGRTAGKTFGFYVSHRYKRLSEEHASLQGANSEYHPPTNVNDGLDLKGESIELYRVKQDHDQKDNAWKPGQYNVLVSEQF